MLTLAAAAAGCGGEGSGDATLAVVVTTTPLGDVVANVVGDSATVDVVLPVGADAHSYQASSQQVATLTDADLVVANGLGLEEGLHDVLEAAEADGTRILEVAPLLDPLPFGGEPGACDPAADYEAGDEGNEEEAGHVHEGSCDPHVWLDPIRMAEAARLIAAELTAIDPAVDWGARADQYAAELVSADAEIAGIVGSIPTERRMLVTNHDAFGYFAARYGFEIIGVVIPGGSTLADPSSAELGALVEAIVATGVPAIFAETSEPTALAEAVAAEAGDIAVVELYTASLGEPGSGADTLIGMLLTDARLIADALA